MARKLRQIRSISEIMLSPEMEEILTDLGEKVLTAATSDPNPVYVDSLKLQTFRSSSRVSVQVGAAPKIGAAVEAKRGTLAKALGSIGA
jgi:hypothetical protein